MRIPRVVQSHRRASLWSISLLMGLICILHRLGVDLVVVGVRANPLDENRLPRVVDASGDQSIAVALEIEYDTLVVLQDAGARI